MAGQTVTLTAGASEPAHSFFFDQVTGTQSLDAAGLIAATLSGVSLSGPPQPVQRAGQVILRVANHPATNSLQLTIERDGRLRQLEVRLPPSPAPGQASGENGTTAAPVALSS